MQNQSKAQTYETFYLRSAPFIIGSTAGIIEVACNHPMWIIKTLLQSNAYTKVNITTTANLSWASLLNPRLLYSGVVANAFSMVPSTALRIGVNETLQSTLANDNNNLTSQQRVMCMATAGVSASFVCSPMDLILAMKYKLKRQAIHFPEQKIGTSFFAAASYLIKHQNGLQCLAYGIPGTILREAMYTPFFLGLTPFIKSKVRPFVNNDIEATIIAGVTTGITASTVTQPLDTIKTCQQDIQLNQTKRPDNWLTTADKIYRQGGYSKFFAGGFWRMARIASAITIMTHVTDVMNTKLHTYKK